MIELTQLDGTQFFLNEKLIEVVLNIPETKILLTNGKYYLVQESRCEVAQRVLKYEQKVQNFDIPSAEPDFAENDVPTGEETPC
jgi:flagellar protein FlbD